MNSPPLHWSIDINAINRTSQNFLFEATAEELVALKRYAEVENLISFKSEVKVSPLSGGKFKVTGTVQAHAIQSSVVNLEAVPSLVDETFSVEYWPSELFEEAGIMPLDDDGPEVLAGGRILIGALLCELLAVSLDPYPRNEGESFEWDSPEPEASPFAELAKFRKKAPDKD